VSTDAPAIRQARLDDVDELVVIYQDAQRWLAAQGSDQWAKNTASKIRDGLVGAIKRSECHVAEVDGKVVGMITVDGFADPEFWLPGDSPDSALYVHRMVINRGVSGRNVGGKLLDRAEELAASRGKAWLRLDAWRTNEKLHAYYRKQGFTHVRTVDLPHRGSGALFQRRVSSHLT
jgi:ribosomal protein S18 acetylase RimI-like enzyme